MDAETITDPTSQALTAFMAWLDDTRRGAFTWAELDLFLAGRESAGSK